MYIKPKRIWVTPVLTAAAYAVYFLPTGTALVQDPAAEGYVAPIVVAPVNVDADGKQQIDLAGLPIAEGTYDVFVAARDQDGNEGDPLELAASTIDITAPAAPTEGGFD